MGVAKVSIWKELKDQAKILENSPRVKPNDNKGKQPFYNNSQGYFNINLIKKIKISWLLILV